MLNLPGLLFGRLYFRHEGLWRQLGHLLVCAPEEKLTFNASTYTAALRTCPTTLHFLANTFWDHLKTRGTEHRERHISALPHATTCRMPRSLLRATPPTHLCAATRLHRCLPAASRTHTYHPAYATYLCLHAALATACLPRLPACPCHHAALPRHAACHDATCLPQHFLPACLATPGCYHIHTTYLRLPATT